LIGRHSCRWESNIKIEPKREEFEDMNSIHLAQDRDELRDFVSVVMVLRVL
jgi:hypothetical protein